MRSHARDTPSATTVLGRPIEAVHFEPPSYARPRAPALLFGGDPRRRGPRHAAHARAALPTSWSNDRLAARPGSSPCVNVRRAPCSPARRNNAKRCRPSTSQLCRQAPRGARRAAPATTPAPAAEDQPETQALCRVARADRPPHRLIALHSTYRMVNWDCLRGAARPRAGPSAAAYPAERGHGLSHAGLVRREVWRRSRTSRSSRSKFRTSTSTNRPWVDCRSARRWGGVDLSGPDCASRAVYEISV